MKVKNVDKELFSILKIESEQKRLDREKRNLTENDLKTIVVKIKKYKHFNNWIQQSKTLKKNYQKFSLKIFQETN